MGARVVVTAEIGCALDQVTIFTPEGRVSGAESVLLGLIGGTTQLEADLLVACPADSELDRRIQKLGIPTAHFRSEKLGEVGAASFVGLLGASISESYRIIRRRTGVVHVFIPQGLKSVAPITALLRRPTVLSVHSVLSAEAIGRANALVDRRLTTISTHRVIAVSDFIKSSLESAGYPSERIVTIHNGVDTRDFELSSDVGRELRQGNAIDPLATVFGVIGRLTPWKGQDLAIRAMAKIRDQSSSLNAHLFIVGSPFHPSDQQYADSLPELARSLRIEDAITFIPNMPDVRAAYSACDVILVPSGEPDPFPTVVLEAGAAGRAVIASGLGGAREAITEGVTGFVIAPELNELVAAMSRFESSDLRRGMGERGRRHITSEFSIEGYRTATLAIWSEMSDRARRA